MSLRKTTSAAMALALLLLTVAASAASADNTRNYRITITNLTEAQWFTPAAVATHRGATDLFRLGETASLGVKEIAENGNLAPMVELFASDSHIWDSEVVKAASGPPPIAPDGSVTFEISSAKGARFFSWVSMLICTNDGFTGLDSIKLPVGVGATATHFTAGYDAGTELNTEDWDDLVPPCAQLTGFGDQGGTESSNPALAEGGVVNMHGGITGDGDLVPSVHGWMNPVASVEITRIS